MEFGKLPSHQMAVAIMYLIGKKLEKLILDIVYYHTFYMHKNIFSVFNPQAPGEGKISLPHSWVIFSKLKNEDKDLLSFRNCKK